MAARADDPAAERAPIAAVRGRDFRRGRHRLVRHRRERVRDDARLVVRAARDPFDRVHPPLPARAATQTTRRNVGDECHLVAELKARLAAANAIRHTRCRTRRTGRDATAPASTAPVDEINDEPELCAHVLLEIGKVFKNDELCRTRGTTGEARLVLPPQRSGHVMDELHAWMKHLFTSKRVEPNSGLGGALRYMLKRWRPLTLFLRRADAPIDNNPVERVLKQAIRQRRASLFYRTLNGARVGDIYTSLIVSTVLHRGDPIRYLTSLFENDNAVAAAPADWLPWNYKRASLEPAQTAAA